MAQSNPRAFIAVLSDTLRPRPKQQPQLRLSRFHPGDLHEAVHELLSHQRASYLGTPSNRTLPCPSPLADSDEANWGNTSIIRGILNRFPNQLPILGFQSLGSNTVTLAQPTALTRTLVPDSNLIEIHLHVLAVRRPEIPRKLTNCRTRVEFPLRPRQPCSLPQAQSTKNTSLPHFCGFFYSSTYD